MSIRPMRASDHAGINRLHRDVWWPERSEAGWRWLGANPAGLDVDAPQGWVLENAGGEPAAFLGNFVQRFWRGDRLAYAATGYSTIVPPAVQGASRALFRTLLRQDRMLAHYTFNANRRSAPLYRLFGLGRWPETTHGLKLSWIIDPLAVAQGRVLREVVRRAPNLIAYRTERFMNARLWADRPLILPPDIVRLSDLADGSPYAEFWRRLKAQGRWIADRSPEILRWRLSDPDRTLRPLFLAQMSSGRIIGSVLAQVSKGSSIEPAFLDIVDLVALDDTPQAIPALTQVLIDNARALGVAKVRLQMVSPQMLERLGPLAGRARHEGGWGHAHVRFSDPTLAEEWSPTPFDGDYGICLRPVPEVVSMRAREPRPGIAADKAQA